MRSHIDPPADRPRQGTCAAELATTLPLIVLLVFGSIQACDLIYLKHSLTQSAYAGSLEVSKPSATQASVSERIEEALAARGVRGATIRLRPDGPLNGIEPGSSLTIEVSAPSTSNLMLTRFFQVPLTMTGSVTAAR